MEDSNLDTLSTAMEDSNLDILSTPMEDSNPSMEDFNLPNPERIVLLEQLQKAIGDVPPHFWAACQICDIKALERIVKCGSEYPEILYGYTQYVYTAIKYWGQSLSGQSQPSTSKQSTPQKPTPSDQSQPSTPKQLTPQKPTSSDLDMTSITPPLKRPKISDSPLVLHRNPRVRELAKERDDSRCVLTGGSAIEVAHIYPFFSIKNQEEDKYGKRHNFWNFLKVCWSGEKVASWEKELFPIGVHEIGVEKVYNLITLSEEVHRMWSQGAFALKPISESDNKRTLEVQFFWQMKQVDIQGAMSLLTKPSSTQGLDHNLGAFDSISRLFNFTAERRIQSGDIFQIQTDSPNIKPLPSFKILELQWFLQRIQGMAGAAIDFQWPSLSESGSECDDEVLEYGEEEYDEKIPELVLDEVGDTSFDSLSSPMKPVQHGNLPTDSKHHTEGDGEGRGEGAGAGAGVEV